MHVHVSQTQSYGFYRFLITDSLNSRLILYMTADTALFMDLISLSLLYKVVDSPIEEQRSLSPLSECVCFVTRFVYYTHL